MLTIKKRFPSQKLYLYGGTAFILGFAAIMTLLVQTNTHIRDFMSLSPITFSSSSKTPATEEETQTEAPIVSQDEVFTAPTSTQTTQTQAPSNTEQPAATEPTPTEPTPTEPVPTDPDPVPTDPTPEEPSDPIGDILDGIIP